MRHATLVAAWDYMISKRPELAARPDLEVYRMAFMVGAFTATRVILHRTEALADPAAAETVYAEIVASLGMTDLDKFLNE